jgi:ParB-like chromosome segregation protein Spo0J
MQIVKKKCKDLIGAEYNPRELTEKQYKDLKDSLLRFGIVDPVLVNVNEERNNIIIGGHQRTRVWQDLGNDEIDCVELDLTLDQERELNVRLNKNTGQFDMDALANYFDQDELIDWGFEAYEVGFSTDELDYSILDDDELDDAVDDMQSGVKKAIQIEFDLQDYEEATRLVKVCRDNELYIGAVIIEALKKAEKEI